MQTVYVTYPGGAETRFDREYYRDEHLPLVMRSWRRYGLRAVTAFYPEGAVEGTVAICVCVFRDESAVRASFSAPEAREVMADVPHFTDATPSQSLARPL